MISICNSAIIRQFSFMQSSARPIKVFEARGLTKTYVMGEVEVHALRDVDLDIFEGEFVVLLGPSGSGRSTPLNILGGLDAPTSGEARWRDHNLVGANDAELTRYRREHVGFVFQFYNLIPSLTVLENVALINEIAENPLDPHEALALVGLEQQLDRRPRSGPRPSPEGQEQVPALRPRRLGAWRPNGRRHLLRDDQLEANELAWIEAREAAARAEEEAREVRRVADAAAGLLVGLYQPEVVGESFYQDAIRRHVPAAGAPPEGISVILELLPEPTNPYDRNAIAVRIDGQQVGHIGRDEAPVVGAMLRKLGHRRLVQCRGTIRGGGDYPYGVSIDGIPDAYNYL